MIEIRNPQRSYLGSYLWIGSGNYSFGDIIDLNSSEYRKKNYFKKTMGLRLGCCCWGEGI